MDKEQLELLEEFVDLCRIRPAVLQLDELAFFRTWLTELGATIPTDRSHNDEKNADYQEPEAMEQEQESSESDIEISTEGVIDKDEIDFDQFMGDSSIEVTEEMEDSADDKRNEALSKFREGYYDESIKLFTEAIRLNPTCAMLYAKRASCFVKMRCPNAAIKDCNKCFELNPDSALAYKWRGMSMKMLGKWEEAFSDLTQSLRLDYADDTYESMKDVELKAKTIREHKRKYERKREDKILNEKRERIRRAQEANEKARKCHDYGDMGKKSKGGCCGGGAECDMESDEMPSGIGDLLNDPELVEDLKDPEVMAALSEIMSNPAAMMKHQSNPKISKIMNRMQSKFGGGMPSANPMDTSESMGGNPKSHVPKPNVADDLD